MRGSENVSATHPQPEADEKPHFPTDLKAKSWGYTLKQTLRQFFKDQCTDIAASLTYYGLLALFPMLIAIFSLLGVLGQGEEVGQAILAIIDDLAPAGAADLLRDPIEQFSTSPAAGLALVTGLIIALWSASAYVSALSRAMNRIYEIEEGRPVWKLKPLQLLITLALVVIVALAGLILVVSGPVAESVGNVLGIGDTATQVWAIAKWPVLLVLVIILLALLYYAAPNVKQPKFRWISLGAVIAVVVMGVATAGFGFYVANFSNYERTYGTLAGIIVFLLWLWIANLAVLLGAEFDAEIERARQLQAGIAAEVHLQLPLRDRDKVVKSREREAKVVREGREIRDGH